mmetsp:Transcript_57941/g.96484  ORF Transcript_57941/g.96484 Transcript_57941/m.96484 type:complete len:197 (-) Transcript_57941:118-708(-)
MPSFAGHYIGDGSAMVIYGKVLPKASFSYCSTAVATCASKQRTEALRRFLLFLLTRCLRALQYADHVNWRCEVRARGQLRILETLIIIGILATEFPAPSKKPQAFHILNGGINRFWPMVLHDVLLHIPDAGVHSGRYLLSGVIISIYEAQLHLFTHFVSASSPREVRFSKNGSVLSALATCELALGPCFDGPCLGT